MGERMDLIDPKIGLIHDEIAALKKYRISKLVADLTQKIGPTRFTDDKEATTEEITALYAHLLEKIGEMNQANGIYSFDARLEEIEKIIPKIKKSIHKHQRFK